MRFFTITRSRATAPAWVDAGHTGLCPRASCACIFADGACTNIHPIGPDDGLTCLCREEFDGACNCLCPACLKGRERLAPTAPSDAAPAEDPPGDTETTGSSTRGTDPPAGSVPPAQPPTRNEAEATARRLAFSIGWDAPGPLPRGLRSSYLEARGRQPSLGDATVGQIAAAIRRERHDPAHADDHQALTAAGTKLRAEGLSWILHDWLLAKESPDAQGPASNQQHDLDSGSDAGSGAGSDATEVRSDAAYPPRALRPGRIAAAMQLNMQSAGLTWLSDARAALNASSGVQRGNAAAMAAQDREERGRALNDVPLIGEPPRYEREIRLPPPDGFVWPKFGFIAFYEHSGEEREAYAAALNEPTCSVADRRTILPPSENCWAFIGTVQEFVASYPHPIRRQSNHVTCGWANWASWRTWPQKILDGSMRKAAEEFLWINCIGDRSWGEQPPSAHQHSVGPPTFIVKGQQHGAPSKTYYIWARNLPRVPPSDVVPWRERWSELAVTGSAEQVTVQRSYTPRNVARAMAHAHAGYDGGDTSDFGRPASVTCKGYEQHLAALRHGFGLFAAHYAPSVSTAWLAKPDRAAALLLVPVSQCERGPCAMVCIREGPECTFGIARDISRTAEQQGEAAAAFLFDGVPTQHVTTTTHFGAVDTVINVPWPTPPLHVVHTVEQLAMARAAGLSAVWCTAGAICEHAAYMPASLAFLRIHACIRDGRHGELSSGIWPALRPLVRYRTASDWARKDDLPPLTISGEHAGFLAAELERGAELRRCFAALDDGDGEMIAIADSVRTAADYASEMQLPQQGFPSFGGSTLRLLPFIERPLSLHTSWFARLPQQSAPPGFRPLPFTAILRPWARRICCHAMNSTAERDFECWHRGHSDKPRPKFVCIGAGGAHDIAHEDGIGTWNALSLVYEWSEAIGLYDLLDFQRPGRTHWVLNALRAIMGTHDDQQLMAFVMEGVRWGIAAPLQIRIAPNLERMDSRIRGVGQQFKKLLDKGLYYKFRPLRRAHETISPDGPGPFIVIPDYTIGSGGTDKADSETEKRIVGDQGNPHAESAVYERNAPCGPPSGPKAISVNDMMGPAPGSVPRGIMLDASQYPMPHPESKPRPRECYRNTAILRHMAEVAETYLAATKDDGRHMFFQFEMSPEEERTCNFLVLVELPMRDTSGDVMLDKAGEPRMELWCVKIVATCMNMGSRNASKIAQRYTDRMLEAFSLQLDPYVEQEWLPKQTAAMRELYADRRSKLGKSQARPFATSGYTDDYQLTFVGPELAAVGTMIWRRINKSCNFWLSTKCGAGTVIDYIGGRMVLNGGFGCLPMGKQARALVDTDAAIAGTITKEKLESHNSFLAHAAEWLDFPIGTLKGLAAPLRAHWRYAPDELAHITPPVRGKFERVRELLTSRAAASFWSGVDETEDMRELMHAGAGGTMFAPRFASDSCSDQDPSFICGVAAGLYFRFRLDGDWRYRHITLTEACGSKLCLIIFPRFFPNFQLAVESDASSALATAIGTAAADDLQYAHHRADAIPEYREAARRAWCTHIKGWANGLSDAGSRDKMAIFFGIAKAYGIRLREVPIPPAAAAFMSDVLRNTHDIRGIEAKSHATSRGRHNLNLDGNMPIAHGITDGMLDELGDIIDDDRTNDMDVSRHALNIARRLGAVTPTAQTANAIVAAFMLLKRPWHFSDDDGAAVACGVPLRTLHKWKAKLLDALLAEASTAHPAQVEANERSVAEAVRRERHSAAQGAYPMLSTEQPANHGANEAAPPLPAASSASSSSSSFRASNRGAAGSSASGGGHPGSYEPDAGSHMLIAELLDRVEEALDGDAYNAAALARAGSIAQRLGSAHVLERDKLAIMAAFYAERRHHLFPTLDAAALACCADLGSAQRWHRVILETAAEEARGPQWSDESTHHHWACCGGAMAAHRSMRSLLSELCALIGVGGEETDMAPLLHAIAYHVGMLDPKPATRRAILAAAFSVTRPLRFGCDHAAATSCSASPCLTTEWVRRLTHAITVEDAGTCSATGASDATTAPTRDASICWYSSPVSASTLDAAASASATAESLSASGGQRDAAETLLGLADRRTIVAIYAERARFRRGMRTTQLLVQRSPPDERVIAAPNGLLSHRRGETAVWEWREDVSVHPDLLTFWRGCGPGVPSADNVAPIATAAAPASCFSWRLDLINDAPGAPKTIVVDHLQGRHTWVEGAYVLANGIGAGAAKFTLHAVDPNVRYSQRNWPMDSCISVPHGHVTLFTGDKIILPDERHPRVYQFLEPDPTPAVAVQVACSEATAPAPPETPEAPAGGAVAPSLAQLSLGDDSSRCNICLEDVVPEDMGNLDSMACWGRCHKCTMPFHTMCIARWVDGGSRTCPCCRGSMAHTKSRLLSYARGATSRGSHNPNMDGNMPFAHGVDNDSPAPSARVRSRPSERRHASPAQASPDAVAAAHRPGGGTYRDGANMISPEPSARGRAPASDRSSPRLVKAERSTAAFDRVCEQHNPALTPRCRSPHRRSQRSASPQPETAAAARRAAAREAALLLATDESPYALCHDRPELLQSFVIDVAEAREAGIPHGTANADEWGFKWARGFAAATGNVHMRPRVMSTALDALRETHFMAMFIIWLSHMMSPSARRKKQGYGQAKTTSCLLAIYAFSRVMRQCARFVPDLAATRDVFKGLATRYKARWGDDALVPDRKQPFSRAHDTAIIILLTTGGVAAWTAVLHMALLTAFCHAMSTGMRTDEWTLSFEGDSYVKRANYSWIDDDGGELPNTREVIASRKNGHLLKGRSAPSKCDRLNVEWGSKPMYFRYDDKNPLNFAWRWQQWELEYPCPPTERQAWPAFSPSGDKVPFTGGRARACLSVILALVMTPIEAAKRSWHSCRVTIATRLFAQRTSGVPRDEIEGIIQSLVRWKTPEAMRIYARMGAEQYADYVDMATRVEAPPGIPAEMPEIDPEHVVATQRDTLSAIDADERAAAKARRTAERVGDSASCAPNGDSAGNASKRRRSAPRSGGISASAAAAPMHLPTFDLGDGIAATHLGEESWGVIGARLRLHNSFWGDEYVLTDGSDNYSPCEVAGYIGKFTFENAGASKHTFVVQCDGYFYPARHSTVLDALADPALKRRLLKAPPPRVLPR